MEKARQIVQENLKNDTFLDKTTEEHEDLKIRINTLCWVNLPPETTLNQAEALSLTIYDIFTNSEFYLKP